MSGVYRSEAMAAIHEVMECLHEVGAIGDDVMRSFDEGCLDERAGLFEQQ